MPKNLLSLRLCYKCRSLFSPTRMFFCSKCFSELLTNHPQRGPIPERFYGLECYTLFNWKAGDRCLGPLLYSLKGGQWHSTTTLGYLAKEFGHKRSPYGVVNNPLLVPAPAATEDGQDHAYRWASALQRVWGGEIVQPLARLPDYKSQKRLKATQRESAKFSWKKTWTPERWGEMAKHRPIIFADDVLTTGSTAREIYYHLMSRSTGPADSANIPQQPGFEVWTIACRLPNRML